MEFEKTGNTEGLEIYFGVNPNEAFAAASQKATRLGKKGPNWKEQEVQAQTDELIQAEKDRMARDENYIQDIIDPEEVTRNIGKVHRLDERTMLKQKYPGISDDLLEKILIDDNPQRKADVIGTIDDYMKLREIGKSEGEAFDIITQSFSKTPTKHAEGGRADFIFGGSAGLKGMWKSILKHLNKGRDKPVTKLFPKLSAREKEMEKLVMGTPEQKAFREGEAAHKLEGIDILINRLKHDKKILERQAKNKAMKDEGLDFLMKHLEETVMPEVYGPHLKKNTNIDKDILQMENIKKNLIMKDRKLNAEGGRIGYAGGGKAGLPAITQGTPQPGMQQPQMPVGPQPTGIPGGTIVASNNMQQNPWMGSQMQQGIGAMPRPQPGGMPRPQPGGMPRPQPGGMPRPMAAEGGRIGFGLGGMSRRAFMKMMAGLAAVPFVGKGVSKVAPKAIPKVTETIVQSNAAGMPAWFPSLVKRVIKEGKDETEKLGTIERQTVHSTKLPESGTELTVTRDLSTDDVIVDIGYGKHGWKDGFHGQPTRLVLKKGEWIEPTKTKKGIKTKDEFMVEEAEFTGGHPENIKFEDVTIEKYGEHGSDFTEVEKYATGKTTKGSKAQKEVWEADWDDSLPDYEDYASGGVARLLGE